MDCDGPSVWHPEPVPSLVRKPLVAFAGLLIAVAISYLPGFDGPLGVANACAQTVPFPTIGPVDPACQRVPDTDTDGILDYTDNCHGYYNPSQTDTDGDSGPEPYEPVPLTVRDPQTGGDACDVDDDGDAIEDIVDNCPKQPNADQADADADGSGDVCDPQTTAPPKAATSATGQISVGRLPRRVLVEELGAGLAVPVSCTAACDVTGELRVTSAVARRLRLGSAVLGRGTAKVAGKASTFVFVRVRAATLRRVRKARTVPATVKVKGGKTTVRRSVRLSA